MASHQNGFDQIGHLSASAHLEAPYRTPRAIGYSNDIFLVAPHMVKIADEDGFSNGIRGGGRANWNYFSAAWYHVQLLVNDNFRTGDGTTHWPYTTGLSSLRHNGFDYPGIRLLTLVKAVEAYTLYRANDLSTNGAFIFFPYLNRLNEDVRGEVVRLSQQNKTRIVDAMINGYVEVQDSYTTSELRQIPFRESVIPYQTTGLCGTSLGESSDSIENCGASVFFNMHRPLVARAAPQ